MVDDKADRLVAVLDFLADASTLLLPGRHSSEVLQTIVSLCTDRLGGYAAVYLRSGETAVAASGAPEYLAALAHLPNQTAAQTAAGQFALEVYLEPMVEGGRQIGSLLLATPQAPGLGNLSGNVARAIGTFASVAVVRAESSAAQQRTVDRLQRALLPTRLPTLEGVAFDAAYRPATKESDVGGDWYDAFDLGNGRIGISVGDVAGHGLDAAVAMGEARRAIRMAATAIDSPSGLLNYANNALPLEDGAAMATAIAGYYDVATRTFTYACAGHPPPIIAIDGRAHLLPGGGFPLGIDPHISSPDWTITIPSDSSLYFYTDGLLEYHRDIIAGERRLAEAIEQAAPTHPENAAVALHDAIFDGIENTDDAATLVLRVKGQRSDKDVATYSAAPPFATISRSVLRALVRTHGIEREPAEKILYATGEAVANAIEHGAHGAGDTFQIEFRIDADRLHITVESNGHWRAFAPRGNERGRGIPIMQSLANDVRVSTTQSSTRVQLTFSTT